MNLFCVHCLSPITAYVDNTGRDDGVQIQCTRCERTWDHNGNEITE